MRLLRCKQRGWLRHRWVPLGCALIGITSIAGLTTGCGGVWYSARANTIAGKVEQAKEVGAETSSPYEYYSAKERMTKAMEEASRADYSDAIDLLDEAEEFADKAIQQATAVRKGAGR